MVMATLCFTLAAAFNSGGTLSVDFPVLQEAKDNYFGFVLNLVNKVVIPNISFSNGHLDGNTFHVAETKDDFNFVAGTSNSIKLSANDLSASFHSSDLRYKELFLVATGSLDAHISSMSVGLELEIITQTLSDGKVVPAVKVLSTSCDLPKDHISLSIHGNIIAEFASLFKSLFMGAVRDEITK